LNRFVTALYRKYRPQTFEEVVGQEAVVRTLSNALDSGKIRQAYLFAGPRGTGKTSMARILAKCVNCTLGPTSHPDGTCPACLSIAASESPDVFEMDAASQRGIDDVREIRERAATQPIGGRKKVYIIDEAHQLTDAAWNALLKLIEEPPPHLLFVFCTTELQKVLATVRSRCQTFVFQRPRLPELVRKLRLIADSESIDVPDGALALIAGGGRGAYRDAESTLDQLASATSGSISVADVLALLGTVEDEVLFRVCNFVVDNDTRGVLEYLEDLSAQGQDIGRLVLDLLEHLRHLMLTQGIGEVPETLPITEEARERLRDQAHQLAPATVVRLIDLLHVAVEDMRQGGDPRLPLELALVKVTRASSDLSREALAFRLERLESGALPSREAPGPAAPGPAAPEPAAPGPAARTAAAPRPAPAETVSSFVVPTLNTPPAAEAEFPAAPATDPVAERPAAEAAPLETVSIEAAPREPEPREPVSPEPVSPEPVSPEPVSPEPVFPEAAPVATASSPEPPRLALDQLQEAWQRSVITEIERAGTGGMPAATMFREARPAMLEGDTLTVEFPATATFQRERAADPKNLAFLTKALYEVTGRRLEIVLATGERDETEREAEHPETEEGFVERMKSTFDAQELDVTS
jgi:DNA polymerase-3 subunit gamma/tau